MEGKIGSLFVGKKQVGGFMDWSLLYNPEVKQWKLIARAYWLFEAASKVTVRLYAPKGYWEGRGAITSITKTLTDTLIHETLELYGEGELQGHE